MPLMWWVKINFRLIFSPPKKRRFGSDRSRSLNVALGKSPEESLTLANAVGSFSQVGYPDLTMVAERRIRETIKEQIGIFEVIKRAD